MKYELNVGLAPMSEHGSRTVFMYVSDYDIRHMSPDDVMRCTRQEMMRRITWKAEVPDPYRRDPFRADFTPQPWRVEVYLDEPGVGSHCLGRFAMAPSARADEHEEIRRYIEKNLLVSINQATNARGVIDNSSWRKQGEDFVFSGLVDEAVELYQKNLREGLSLQAAQSVISKDELRQFLGLDDSRGADLALGQSQHHSDLGQDVAEQGHQIPEGSQELAL